MRRHLPIVLLVLALLGAETAEARNLVLRGVGSPPLADALASVRVKRSAWEPRPNNWKATHTVPTSAQLRLFYRKSDMPYKDRVTGRFRGTTDEVLQWGAHKWGFHPDLFRAVAVVESWWNMSTLGDKGDSFGLMQMRRPYHCCLPFMRDSAAFNVDYYGGILRAYYDGKQGWLNTVERGRHYKAGDLRGSVGVWASGRWYLGKSDWYVGMVYQRLRERTWHTDRWF